MFQGKKVGIIGTGKIGQILIRGLLNSGAIECSQLLATDASPAVRQELAETLGITILQTNADLAEQSDYILFCMKPYQVEDVCHDIQDAVRPDQVIISVAAGVTTDQISGWLGKETPVVRGMPNTPALIREGITGICKGLNARDEHLQVAERIFASVGRVVPVEEMLMDAVTGLSSSGPAYIYMIIESLAEGGVKVGLPRDTALQLAAQTVAGAARMVLETGEHPAKLKDEVTTPAGTTIDGILELEEGKLRVTLIKAVVKATERSRGLSHSFANRKKH